MAARIDEIDQIFERIENGDNFLLSGGAGSGKTYSLIEVVKRVYQNTPNASVACITYTNIAVKEIKDRVIPYKPYVSTIHDFLWDNIKGFQNNLKKCLVRLIEMEKLEKGAGIKYKGNTTLDEVYFKNLKISYREWKKLENGIVSHDEVISLAEIMFSQYPRLCGIVKDKFKYILIDEYQDTFEKVIRIFLDHSTQSSKKNIIGLFGDVMQSIYDEGIGEGIQDYIKNGKIKEVIKQDNRRNPKLVIDLANKLRTDDLEQKPANDTPNFKKQGSIKFLYSGKKDIEHIKRTSFFEGWDFEDLTRTKELYLTENLIAPKVGFPELINIYDKDPIFKLRTEVLTKIEKGDVTINEENTFEEIVNKILTKKRKEKILEEPKAKGLYESVKDWPFKQVKKIYLNKSQLIGAKKATPEDDRKDDKRDKLIRHLFNIQECIFFYENKKYNEFIRKTHYKVKYLEDKKELARNINTLKSMTENTIEEIIDFAHEKRIWQKDDRFYEFIKEKEYVFNRVKKVKYQEVCDLYDYVEGMTPFSTQHNIKGTEFENVFVILDNGSWNKYSFEALFEGDEEKTTSQRAKKIFYVCCTRAKDNLIIFHHNPSESVLNTAKRWFGIENIHKI